MPRDGFLESLPERARAEIASAARTICFRRGETLFLAGDAPSSAFLITQGVVKLIHRDIEGREAILAVCFPGRLVGAGAALVAETHRHDAYGASRGTALLLTADLIERLVASDVGAARAVAVEMARWSQRFEDAAVERTSRVAARVAGRLLDLSDAIGRDGENGRYVEMPMPYADLARLSASSRETVSKTLHRFRREGLIDFRGRTMRIQRPDMLQRIRCGARAS
jgi:CRP/FNR family transcriptional regulator